VIDIFIRYPYQTINLGAFHDFLRFLPFYR